MENMHTYDPEVRRITIGETARRLGVTVDTVRRWCENGDLTAYRTPGKQRRFEIADVESLAAKRGAA